MTDVVSLERFKELVQYAINAVPEPFATSLAEIVVTIEEEASPIDYPGGLFGLYIGGPVGERYPIAPPRQIIIFRFPMVAAFRGDEELKDQIRVTLLHELGHYYGMDHHDLDRLGYL